MADASQTIILMRLYLRLHHRPFRAHIRSDPRKTRVQSGIAFAPNPDTSDRKLFSTWRKLVVVLCRN